MTELVLLLQAELDIQAAFNCYEDFQEGRGEVFMRHLDAAFTLMRQHPEIAPFYGEAYRRMLIRDFPYGVFYQVQSKRVIVAAVLDLRQDPAAIRRKLFGQGGG